MTQLPAYFTINGDEPAQAECLRRQADTVTFPLSEADEQLIEILNAKYEAEENCSGIAAPQLGFSRRMIIFAVDGAPNLKKWRPDLSDTMLKSIWINPSYTPATEEKHTDYEGCFSVKDLAGPVARFTAIDYQAQLPTGEAINGKARGFLARVIQHETDHLNGILFTDLVAPAQLLNITEYRQMRRRAMTQ